MRGSGDPDSPTGGSYDAGGWLNGPPSAYGATFDGARAVALGVRDCSATQTPVRATAQLAQPAVTREKQLALVRPSDCPGDYTSIPPGPTDDGGTAADQLLGCGGRKLVLEDVLPGRRRVRLVGVADKSLIGKTVNIVFFGTHKVVAKAVVKPDQSFATTAPLPPRKLRRGNRARYEARVGRERSLNLKLYRRMLVTAVKVRSRKVTIRGRVVRPLAVKPKDRVIRLQQIVNCKVVGTVKRLTPKRTGRFSVTVKAPAGATVAVYRLRTRVRRNRTSRRIANTFTLPRAVDFG